MNNMDKNYVCLQPFCEIYYPTSSIILKENEAVPGNMSEHCCPKCGVPLDEYKEGGGNKWNGILFKASIAAGIIAVAVALYFLIPKHDKRDVASKPHSGSSPSASSTPQRQDIVPPEPATGAAGKKEKIRNIKYPPQVSVNNLQENLLQLAGHDISPDAKERLKAALLQLFSTHATVHKRSRSISSPDNIEHYLGNLCTTSELTNKTIQIEPPILINGKIEDLYVTETYTQK